MDWGGSSREKDNGKGERREIDSRKGGGDIMGKEKRDGGGIREHIKEKPQEEYI